jgi:hypothetical protein
METLVPSQFVGVSSDGLAAATVMPGSEVDDQQR